MAAVVRFAVLGAVDGARLQLLLGPVVHWLPSKVQLGSGDLTACLLKNLQTDELRMFQPDFGVENCSNCCLDRMATTVSSSMGRPCFWHLSLLEHFGVIKAFAKTIGQSSTRSYWPADSGGILLPEPGPALG